MNSSINHIEIHIYRWSIIKINLQLSIFYCACVCIVIHNTQPNHWHHGKFQLFSAFQYTLLVNMLACVREQIVTTWWKNNHTLTLPMLTSLCVEFSTNSLYFQTWNFYFISFSSVNVWNRNSKKELISNSYFL